jgi:hypothetical protein
MTQMTLEQLSAEVRSNLGNRIDLDTRLTQILNLTQIRIARRFDFDELKRAITMNTSITADPAADKIITIPVSQDIKRLYNVRVLDDSRSHKLTQYVTSEWDTKIPEPEYFSRGLPTMFTRWGRRDLELYKVPDKEYPLFIRLIVMPAELTTGESSDLLHMDDVILALATSWSFLSLGQRERANEWFVVFRNSLRDVLDMRGYEYDLKLDAMPDAGVGAEYWRDPFIRSIT